jgi:hypothetical protein
MTMSIGEILDLEPYPLDKPESDAYLCAVDEARSGLRSEGCAVIEQLIRPDALRVMSDEANSIKSATHFSQVKINAYFDTEPDAALPARHPANIFLERSSGFVPGDAFQPQSLIDAVYRWPHMLRFVADCLEIEELFCYADPLACLTINVLNAGQQFSWHYDNNDFGVTILLDEADSGGLFRYAPRIRSREDENAEAAAAVMLGDDSQVKALDLQPGDMQIFQGRYSLHQVTRVDEASRPRYTAVLAYTLEDGLIGGLTRTMQLFGRTLPIHEDAATAAPVREDTLLD